MSDFCGEHEGSSSSATTASAAERGYPVACLVVGMAGSGKSTLMQRLAMALRSRARRAARTRLAAAGTPVAADAKKRAERAAAAGALYCVNLDPAVAQCPFGPNVDIRDTVKYREVMAHYHLGPNGAIMTSLNLFATKFDQVIALLQRRCPPELRAKPLIQQDDDDNGVGDDEGKKKGEKKEEKKEEKQSAATGATEGEGAPECRLQHVLVDTPGQIEAFTWSASGALFTESFASVMPTVVVYVVDVPRSAANPSTFMANMLYACSILYRTRLPIVLALTKTDIVSEKVVLDWMHDFDVFEEALNADPTYAHDLAHSMGLVLEEFYAGLHAVGVSAVTGDGTDALLAAVDRASRDYFAVYLADLRERRRRERADEQRRQQRNIARIERDMRDGRGGDPIFVHGPAKAATGGGEDGSSNSEEDDE